MVHLKKNSLKQVLLFNFSFLFPSFLMREENFTLLDVERQKKILCNFKNIFLCGREDKLIEKFRQTYTNLDKSRQPREPKINLAKQRSSNDFNNFLSKRKNLRKTTTYKQ